MALSELFGQGRCGVQSCEGVDSFEVEAVREGNSGLHCWWLINGVMPLPFKDGPCSLT